MEIRTNRLKSIRQSSTTTYVQMESVREEVQACRRLCAERNWPVIDVTRRSIEETAAAILKHYSAREAKRVNESD